MARLYVNPTLEKSIRVYCELNEIEDVNAFANRCLMQGFSIIKFGVSPKDNIDRENKGLRDIKKNAKKIREKEPPSKNEGKQEVVEAKEGETKREDGKEEIKLHEENKVNVTVRRIKVIKK